MQFHRGRLIDHVHIVVRDLEKSRAFYKSVLSALNLKFDSESERHFSFDEVYVSAKDEESMRYSLIHLAFQTDAPEMVQAFHQAAIDGGGQDNGQPGERAQYHPGYYGAFVRDPDGNNIEAVYHGASDRTAPSIIVTPK